jgi:hypothetical protein
MLQRISPRKVQNHFEMLFCLLLAQFQQKDKYLQEYKSVIFGGMCCTKDVVKDSESLSFR